MPVSIAAHPVGFSYCYKKVRNPTKLSLIQHLGDTLGQDLGKASAWGYNKLNRWVFTPHK